MDAPESAVEIPRLTVADVLIQEQRLILRQHADRIDARIDAIRQRKIDDSVFCAERNGRLGDVVRQCVQPAALPSRKQHCYTFLLSLHVKPPLKYN